jgi:NAD(P)H-quinone oxidoreductase subunit 4L
MTPETLVWLIPVPPLLAFFIIVFAVAAAETAVGLALIISIYRRRKTVIAEEVDLMKW